MTEASEIRTSLLKIKETQDNLLKELRTEHDALQGFLSSNADFGENFNEFRPNGVGFGNDYRTFESSLDLSKSDGNGPSYKKLGCGSTTTGADDVLESNYKKIEGLLVKQRKIYEENHALQEENESLIEDYRAIKKLFYEQKETNKNATVLFGQLHEILYEIIQGLLLESDNSEILLKAKKNWGKFGLQNVRLFQEHSESEKNFEECETYLNKIYMLLDQEFKINTIKSKDSEIEELKEQVKRLAGGIDRAKEREREGERLENILLENKKQGDRIRELERKFVDSESENLGRIKKIEIEILHKARETEELAYLLQQKNEQISLITKNLHNIKSQQQTSQKDHGEAVLQLTQVSNKLTEKEELYQKQVEVSKKQNQMIERMNNDIVRLQSEIEGLGLRRSENEGKLFIENEGLIRELNGLKIEFARYRENTHREINSLMEHTKQIKNQHNILIRSEDNARLSEQRFREMAVGKATSMRLSSNVDHLWSVKEIEYENIIKLLEGGQ